MKLLVVLFLCIAAPLCAQEQTNGTAVGFPPGGHFTGSEIESVQTNNGNLHVNIPLWSLPGRGVSTAASFVYDSKGWYVQAFCPDTSADCSYSVAPELGNTMQMTILRSTDYQSSGGGVSVHQICGFDTNKYTLGGNYTLREPNGTKHHYVPDPLVINAATDIPCWDSLQDTSLYADDASGFMRSPTNESSKSGGLPGINDTNGNYASTIDTLGRTIAADGSYYDSQGQLRQIQVTTQTVTISTHLCGTLTGCGEYCQTLGQCDANSWTVPHIITLPNGLTYTIEYYQDDEGEIKSITLPTGAIIAYTYTPAPDEDHGGARVRTRTVTAGGQSSQWTYDYTSLAGAVRTTTVTGPNGKTVYTCSSTYETQSLYAETANPPNNGPVPLDPPCAISKEQYYDSANHLIKTVDSPLNEFGLVQSQTATWAAANQVSKTEFDYDSMNITLFPDGSYGPQTAPISWGNVIEKREYGFGTGGPGPLLRTTDYTYLHTDTTVNPNQNRAQYLAANIADRPTSETIWSGPSGSGTKMAQTKYYYDEGSLTSTANAQAGNHDYAHYGSSSIIRGNLTRISRWDNTSNTWLDTVYSYDDLGNKRTATDPKGNTTTYDYTDAFSGASCNTSSSPSYAFPTTITAPSPFGFKMQHAYYQCTSLLQSTKDQNDINNSRNGTVYTYDLVNRFALTTRPDGGSTTVNYGGNAANGYQDPLPLTVTTTAVATPDPTIVSSIQYDGLGRPSVETRPDGATIETTYDNVGNVFSVTNPHFGSTTDGTIYKYYDPLGRITQQTQQDNNNLFWCYDNTPSNGQSGCSAQAGTKVINGTWVDSTDEVGVHWQRTSDAFGNLLKVVELGTTSSPLSFETDYSYNTLNNLSRIDQPGGTGETARATRGFLYDSLSRLTSASNPETGTVSYGYLTTGVPCAGDASLPCSKTDARSIETNYSYDALNRLTGKTYYGGSNSTPSSCYLYDGNSVPNSANRLIGEWTQSGSCPTNPTGIPNSTAITWKKIMSYNEMGYVTSEQQCAWAPCGSPRLVSYGYDLAGSLTSSTNGIPVGTTVDPTVPGISLTYGADSAGRLSKITSNWSGANSATLFEADQSINGTSPYGPFGLTAAQIGVTGPTQQVIALLKGYDNRGRINSILATAQTGSALPPGTLTITSSLNNVVSGMSQTVSVHDICNSACGSIQFSVSEKSEVGTAALGADGSASFQIIPLAQGQYTLTVGFPGNAQYSASSTSTNFSVVASGLPPTSLSATLSATPIVQGTSPTLTTVLGCNTACGIVTYLLDSQPLQTSTVNADGTVASISLSSSLAIGQHTIAISYGGNTIQSPAATSIAFTVVSNILTLTVGLDVNPVPAGETPRILTSANCNACGTVNYALDGTVFQQSSIGSNGSAIATLTPQLSNGSHLLTVSYQGNGAYQPSSTSLTFQVIPNTLPVPSLVAASQLNPAAVGTSPTVIAVLGCSTACGYVTYSMDGQVFQSYPVNSDGTLPSPSVSPNVAVGAHTITVSYGGNAQFAPASTSITFSVVPAVSMTISGSLNVNPVPAGETPMMLSQVGCSIPCGYMNYAVDGTIIQGSTILPDGTSGNVLSPSPSVGWHILTVSNLGDDTHAAVSTSFAFQVIPDALPVLSLVVSLPTNPILYGTSPQVITVLGLNTSSAGGAISWFVDGALFQKWTPSAGQFTGPPAGPQIPSDLTVGAHTLTVQYGGDGNYAPSSTSVPFTVVSTIPMTVTASLNVNPVPADETPLISSQVSCNASCGYMNFAVDGTIFQGSSILPDGSGGNVFNPVPPVGWHIFTTTNLGDATHVAASSSFPFQVIPDTLPVLSLEVSLPTNPVPYGETPGITCILGSNTSSANGFMSFSMDGVLFQKWQVINGATGGPPIPPNLPVGAHILTVHYGGDSNYAPATAIYPFTVVANQ